MERKDDSSRKLLSVEHGSRYLGKKDASLESMAVALQIEHYQSRFSLCNRTTTLHLVRCFNYE